MYEIEKHFKVYDIKFIFGRVEKFTKNSYDHDDDDDDGGKRA